MQTKLNDDGTLNLFRSKVQGKWEIQTVQFGNTNDSKIMGNSFETVKKCRKHPQQNREFGSENEKRFGSICFVSAF